MSYTKKLCTPALIYILFSVTQIMIDMFKGLFNTAFIKFCVSFLITLLLHYLCVSGYKVVSWIIVFIPFILMTVITYILLLSLGMDPYKGRLSVIDPNQKISINTDIRKQYSDVYGSATNAINTSLGGSISSSASTKPDSTLPPLDSISNVDSTNTASTASAASTANIASAAST